MICNHCDGDVSGREHNPACPVKDVEMPPDFIASVLREALRTMQAAKITLESGRDLDRRFGGAGRYEYDTWKSIDQKGLDHARHVLAEFREHAPKNNIEAQKVIDAFGGESAIGLSDAAKEWIR